ncbi:helix-turn-helix transcriptional regulator [Endozoicomonas euniceicola]|uniref:DNA-binding protein n=1 Tax=Endozoicomonas euniceicola TaxID=1234143 RepID=A0ABY6H3L0_9GAMM|nr:DNA-binding protein [Endozoicomonas euniceicola]UYM18724.1 DNA-binding protein [Endozoicomonas euniceicola]
MNVYEFTLRFSVQGCKRQVDDIVESLGGAGCTDALIGLGHPGRIAMMFARESDQAVSAICSAINDVKNAVPEAVLIEASPDLVGLTDTAELLGFSRQNMRKLMTTNPDTFPIPVYDGKRGLWHLESLLAWLEQQKQYDIDHSLFEVAKANRNLNQATAGYCSDPEQVATFSALLANY